MRSVNLPTLSSVSTSTPVALFFDDQDEIPLISVIFSSGASITATVQYTVDRIYDDGWSAATGNWIDATGLTNITTSSSVALHLQPTAIRLKVTARSAGSVYAAITESDTSISVPTGGVSGNTILTTSGAPSDISGVNGDYAYDPSAKIMYGPKSSGTWPAGISLAGSTGATGAAGTNGNTIINTVGAPSNGTGSNGDFAIDTVNKVMYGPKSGSVWPAGVSFSGSNGANGNTILSTSGAPSNASGTNGDYAYDSTAKIMYGPKSGGVWPAGVSLAGPTGPTGPSGNTILSGSGAPSAGTGVNGDFYFRTSDSTFYGPKAAGSWPAPISMVGSQGPAGSGAVPWANVKDSPYNAVGNNVNDDTAEIQAALNSGYKIVYIPAGTYKCTGPLTVPNNVTIIGDGANVSILDFSTQTTGGATHLTISGGTWTSLPDLTVNPTKNDRTLTFASAPSVVRGDIIALYNPTDSSWSDFRTYYRAGEFCRVAAVSGNVVTIQGSLCDDYTAASLDIYKLTGASCNGFKDFSIKGWASTANQVTGISLQDSFNTHFENVRITGCSYAQVSLSKCHTISMRDCYFEEDFSSDFSGDYGAVIANSTNVYISGGYFSASRHAIAMGGGDVAPGVPNRYIYIHNATICSTGSAPAADIHGNSEYVTYDACIIDGGIKPAGDHVKITNNHIRGRASGDEVFGFSELRGCNIYISGNTIENEYVPSSRGMFIDIGGNSNDITAGTTKGGNIIIRDNTFLSQLAASSASANPIKICLRGYVGSQKIGVYIENNVLRNLNSAVELGYSEISVLTSGTNAYDIISFKDNHFSGASGLWVRNATAGQYSASKVSIEGNTIENGMQRGFRIEHVQDRITFKGNTVTGCVSQGATLEGRSGSNVDFIHIEGNSCYNNVNTSTGSTTTDVDISAGFANRVVFHDNVTGTAPAASFAAGFSNINTLWQGRNVNFHALPLTTTAVSTNNAI